jgi:hypothetical protein
MIRAGIESTAAVIGATGSNGPEVGETVDRY